MEQFFCKVVSVKFSSIVVWECALNAFTCLAATLKQRKDGQSLQPVVPLRRLALSEIQVGALVFNLQHK